MTIALGQLRGMQLVPSLFMLSETVTGCAGIHLYLVTVNKSLHRAGPVLMSFLARDCCCSRQHSSLTVWVKLRFTLLHTSRLCVKKRYGFTYSG